MKVVCYCVLFACLSIKLSWVNQFEEGIEVMFAFLEVFFAKLMQFIAIFNGFCYIVLKILNINLEIEEVRG